MNDDPGTYYDISNSIRQQSNRVKRIEKSAISAFDLQGYQVVRGQFLQIRYEGPTLNISNAMYQKTYMTDSLPRQCLRNKGERDRYYATNTHPGIIDCQSYDV